MATAAEDPPKKAPLTLYARVLEALETNTSNKGMTVQSIKRYIVKTYPETEEHFSNKRMRTALDKGIESTEIITPKSKEEEGQKKGRYLLNRPLMAKKRKAESAKAKKKSDAEDEKKPKASQKSDKAGTMKAKVAKKTKSKPPKSPTTAARKIDKSKSPKYELTSTSKSPKTAARKPTSTKPELTSTPKSTKRPLASKAISALRHQPTPKGREATPKVSKADKAGKRSKTAAIKKAMK